MKGNMWSFWVGSDKEYLVQESRSMSPEYVKQMGVTQEHGGDSGSLETAHLPKDSTVSENTHYKL